MGKYPLLDALRAAREQREAPVRAPLEAALQASALEGDALREAKQALENILRTPMAKALTEHFARKGGRELPPVIYRAIDEAMNRPENKDKDVINIPISVQELRFARLDELEARILAYYADWLERRATVEARKIPKDHAVRVRITIPQLAMEHAVSALAMDDFSDRRATGTQVM